MPDTEPTLHILHLEDDVFDAELISHSLARSGLNARIHQVTTRAEFEAAVKNVEFDLILSDYTLPSWSGIDALALARELRRETPFVFVSGTIGEERAIQAVKAGAVDYVLKDNLRPLAPAIERALQEAAARRERDQAQAALIESRHFLERVTEAVPDLIYVYDLASRRATYLSGNASRVLGFEPEERDEDPMEWLHPDDRPAVEQMLVRFQGEARIDVAEVDFRLQGKDESWRWFRARNTEFSRNADGAVVQILGSLQDITQRRAVTRRMRRQASLLNFARDAILEMDLEGRICFWNHGAADLYGWAPEAAQEACYFELLRAEPEISGSIIQTVLSSGGWSGELRLLKRDGEEVVVQSRWSIVAEEGEAASLLVIDTDISEKKALELQIIRSQRLESIGALAGGVAHDFSNILTPVLMGIEILRAQMEKPECLQILKTMEQTAGRGVGLIRQVLALARGGENSGSEVRPGKIIDEIAMIIRETFPSAIRLTTSFPPNLWSYSGDPTQLHQVLLNLCVNARDAMPRGGLLQLEAANVRLDENYARMAPRARPGAYVRISVMDEGEGIAPEHLGQIFDPFFTTKDIGKGTGLGLSTSRRIVESHGGFLNVSSQVGRGSRFDLFFPAEPGQDEGAEREQAGASIPCGRGECILIIDGDKSVGEMTAEALATYGYKVHAAVDGAEGVAIFAQNRGAIDLVLVDAEAQFLDGAATARVLRKLDPAVPIVAVCPAEAKRNLEEGLFNTVLEKPFTAEEMLVAVRAVLDSCSASSSGA